MTSSKQGSRREAGTACAVFRDLRVLASTERARVNAWFFKTGKGQYGGGDTFLGVTVPDQRKVARAYRDLPLTEVEKLLASQLHEVRLTALLILTYKVEATTIKKTKSRGTQKQTSVHSYDHTNVLTLGEVVKFYLAHLERVNNWDLVDLSAPSILGRWCLETGNTKKLYTLARSKKLWERRIAIVATYAFIRAGELSHTFAISELFLADTHDLIHKATGWMLREAGKRDVEALRAFLSSHAHHMPRTMLRYAIERLLEEERRRWRSIKKSTPMRRPKSRNY